MSKKTIVLLYCFVTLLSLASCGNREGQEPVANSDPVVAFVNYDKIRISLLRDMIGQFISKYGISTPKNKERYKKIGRFVLDELVLNKIYIQEAERLGITFKKEELENFLERVAGDYSKEELSRSLEANNFELNEWKEQIKESKLFEKLVEQEVRDKIKINESEIKSYYKANSKDFMLPERVQALQIVVNNELEAEAIYNKLQEGANFIELAKIKSVSPEGANGGDLGFFSRGLMPKEFDDAVFNLKVGKFSKVVQTPYGHHIFKVIKKKRAAKMLFDDAKGEIREKLIKEKEKIAFKNWIENLKAKSIIVIKDDVLSGI